MRSEGDESTDAVEIEAKLVSMRKQSGTLRVVTGRGVQKGDCVICDFDAGPSSRGVGKLRRSSDVWCLAYL